MALDPSETHAGETDPAVLSTRGAVWKRVLLHEQVCDEAQWAEIKKRFKHYRGGLYIEQILLDDGLATIDEIEHLRRVARLMLWNQLLVRTNVISEEQWGQVLKAFHDSGGRGSIGKLLVTNGLADKKKVQRAREKVAFILGKPKLKSPGNVADASPPEAAKEDALSGDLLDEITDDDSFGDEEEEPNVPVRRASDMDAIELDEADSNIVFAPIASGDTVNKDQLNPRAIDLIRKAVEAGASDVHLTAGTPPFMRLNGRITYFDEPPLPADEAERMVVSFMNQRQRDHFEKHNDLDLSYEHEELGRFRVNALSHFRGPSIIFRIIPRQVPTLEGLGLPASLGGLTEWTQGLVLVTGPAGCGKSTTAAALVDLVNSTRKDHVITVEDPVEFIHPAKGCNVTQRQVPRDTESFATALRAALREDPDVIMIGEMRDLETISLALTAAETGHLVIGTLHTKSAARTVDRIIDVFPTDQQAQIRIMISEALRGIVSQSLVPRADGNGRVVALEVLYNNTAVANAIRDAKTFQLPSMMQTGKKQGMQLMDESLLDLVAEDVITRDEAEKVAENPKRFADSA